MNTPKLEQKFLITTTSDEHINYGPSVELFDDFFTALSHFNKVVDEVSVDYPCKIEESENGERFCNWDICGERFNVSLLIVDIVKVEYITSKELTI